MAVDIAHGYETEGGLGAETTVGTPVAATERLCILDESLNQVFSMILDPSLCGTASQGAPKKGTKIAEGGWSQMFRYDKAQLLLTHFFGTRNDDTPGVGTNTYVFDSNIDGDSLTVAVNKQVSVWEFAGVKVNEIVLSSNPADGVRLAVTGFAVNLDRASVLNTPASLNALPVNLDFMIHQEVTLRIRDQLGALASPTDEYDISDFTLTITRNLEPTEVNSENRLEALENDFQFTTLEATFPRYCEDTFIDAHEARTLMQADLVVSDGTSSKTVNLPELVVTEFTAPVEGAAFVEHNVMFTSHPDRDGSNAFMVLSNTSANIEMLETGP